MEVSVILSVLAILSVLVLPQIRGFVHAAQRVRAKNDLQSISNAMLLFVRDVGPRAFHVKGKGKKDHDAPELKMLVTTGDIPELGPDGDSRWLNSVNGFTVDFFDNYLVTNTPGGDPSRGFPTPNDRGKGRFAWRGSYATGPLHADPWGNRYMMNTQFMQSCCNEDVVVYSAGPNEKVETDFATDGLFPGGDDLVFLFSADRGGKGGKKGKSIANDIGTAAVTTL